LIIIKELPYKVEKSKLVAHISQIAKDKIIEGLKGVSDYSNYKEVVNIHIKFDPDYDGEVILNQLYKLTTLQSSFSVKIRALVDNKPQIFSLKEIITNFIENRQLTIKKKALFLLNKNNKELVNLETRKFIIDHHQEIAKLVTQPSSEDELKSQLQSQFDISLEMAERILDTSYNFRQFTIGRRDKLESDIKQLVENNQQQLLVINSREEQKIKLIEELQSLRDIYQFDERKTQLTSLSHTIAERQLIPREERLVILSKSKKDEKINNYLTNYNVEVIEGTNIPSVGKELKTRGNN
jgi:DNA gyrase subunit A